MAVPMLMSLTFLSKRMAGVFRRMTEKLNRSDPMCAADGHAFILPSKSSVQSRPCATIFPSAETVHHTSVRHENHAHADRSRMRRLVAAEPSWAR
jgi:hypothetical protein